VGVATNPNSRIQQGEETRRKILRVAVELASRQGLDALSIGDLAKELGMSKSGLFAHFGSKEELQIATIEAAERVFGAAIIKPAREEAKPGLARLIVLLERYICYLEDSVAGGCFFSAAAAEFDDRPGRIRDRIAQSMRTWCDMLEAETRCGLETGELDASVDPQQLAFELEALTHHANFSRRLMADEGAFARARTGIRQRLRSVSTAEGQAVLESRAP
jgi:AcrR family transcriptional regulator